MNLRWLAKSSVACFHAALALFQRQTLIDPALSAALERPSERLRAALVEERVPAQEFWNHLIPLAAGNVSVQELAELTLRKTIGQAETALRLRRFREALADLKNAFSTILPHLDDNLAVQVGVLRPRWDYHGNGLLGRIANWTDPGVLVEEATVVVVYPACGGGGGAHLVYNWVRMEAVDDDPVPELPEMVRLAWLLSMLNLDLPRYSESLRPRSLDTVAGLAMIPIALTAAKELELTECNEQTIDRAVRTWLPPAGKEEHWIKTLNDWWGTYVAMRPPWPTALRALDVLLE
jgi:hypothetical protein